MLIVYCGFFCLFLTPACLLISYGLYKLLNYYSSSYQIQNQTHTVGNSNSYIEYIKTIIIRKQWLNCILLLEGKLYKFNDCDWEYSYYIGVCYYKMGIYDLAQYHYLRALQTNSNNSILLLQLAQTYIRVDNIEEARRTCLKILAIDPDNQTAKQFMRTLI